MQETIEKLKTDLAEVFEYIEQHIEIEQIDLNEFAKDLNNYGVINGIDRRQQSMLTFRETIVKYKGDNTFWDKDIPQLISLLENSMKKIQSYRTDTTKVGGKNLPNEDIINLLKQKILTLETVISKTHKGQQFNGYLTFDGYLELEINGIIKKLSLRRAARDAWGSNPPNQWTFWEVLDSEGDKRPLEYFRVLLK